jgi:membrane-associated phospholipid phosphatase
MAALFACLAFEVRRWFGWVCVAYAAILQIGSIILGWHYAVDGYAGLILACAIWLTVKRYVPKPDKETESTLLPHQ